MGIIQNAINQTLQTAGIATRLSPEYETKVKLGELKKEESSLNLQEQLVRPTVTDFELEKGETIGAKDLDRIDKRRAEIAQQRFTLSPSKRTLREAHWARSMAGEGPIMQFPADPDEIAQEQAMLEAAAKQSSQLKQEENFKNYVSNLETSLGGKVGDLPLHVQALVAQQLKEQGGKKDGE